MDWWVFKIFISDEGDFSQEVIDVEEEPNKLTEFMADVTKVVRDMAVKKYGLKVEEVTSDWCHCLED